MEQIADFLLDRGGAWGVVVIILLYVCRRLYNDKEDAQEKRIAENKAAIEAIANMTQALNSVKEVLNASRRGETS